MPGGPDRATLERHKEEREGRRQEAGGRPVGVVWAVELDVYRAASNHVVADLRQQRVSSPRPHLDSLHLHLDGLPRPSLCRSLLPRLRHYGLSTAGSRQAVTDVGGGAAHARRSTQVASSDGRQQSCSQHRKACAQDAEVESQVGSSGEVVDAAGALHGRQRRFGGPDASRASTRGSERRRKASQRRGQGTQGGEVARARKLVNTHPTYSRGLCSANSRVVPCWSMHEWLADPSGAVEDCSE